MTPRPRHAGARTMLLILISTAAFLHLVQLPLYPVDPKWTAALIGAIVYTVSAIGIYKNHLVGYVLALSPVLAAFFVGGILIFGPPPGAPAFHFNIFTALAALVEIPAVILDIHLLGKGIHKDRGASENRRRRSRR